LDEKLEADVSGASLREYTGVQMEDHRVPQERPRRCANSGCWATSTCTEAAPWTAIKTDRDRAAVAVRYGLNLAALFAKVSEPFIPFACEKISEALGVAVPGDLAVAGRGAAVLSALPVGRAIRAPEVLFKKVENEQVAEWTARFGGAE
jgi:methionyl-tRNA synthetase